MIASKDTFDSTTLSSAVAPDAHSRDQLPNSKRVYVHGEIHRDILVPMRQIELAPTKLASGQTETNEPVRVYDCSGPWGDPDFKGSVEEGLPALRAKWLDLLSGGSGRRQWLLANLAAPALALAFGRPASELDGESRLQFWRRVDPSRTGFDGTQVDGRRPAKGYAAFALAAEAMPLPGGGDPAAVPWPGSRVRFRDWAAMSAGRPGASDIAHHLSTLFPPIRPRGGYLEVRFCDAQPPEWLDVPVSVLAVLLGEERATLEALELVGHDPAGLASGWAAAEHGSHSGLQQVGRELFAIASRQARTGSAGRLPPLAPDLIDGYAERYLRHVGTSRADSARTTADADGVPAPIGGAA